MGILQYLDWGIAAIFAFGMFAVCRQLIMQMRHDRVFMEDRLTKVTEDYNEVVQSHTEAKIKNTAALTELTTWLKARNGHQN